MARGMKNKDMMMEEEVEGMMAGGDMPPPMQPTRDMMPMSEADLQMMQTMETMPTDANENPMANISEDAKATLMSPDEDIAAVVMSRLSNISEMELKQLQDVITPATAPIIMKILPELMQILEISLAKGGQQQMPEQQMGALGAM